MTQTTTTVRDGGRDQDFLAPAARLRGAGIGGLEELTDEQLEDVYNVNILAMFRLVRAALPHLRRRIGSLPIRRGHPHPSGASRLPPSPVGQPQIYSPSP